MKYDLKKIRIKCAEIVGWKKHTELIDAGCSPEQSDCPLVANLVPLPDYIASADAALELVKWLEAQGWSVHVFFEGGKCTVELVAHTLTIDSEANTFQVAICLALLRACDINQWD